ncbi:MAG TPA: NCS2 family permease [candidate division Zixibacteria bacterium]|nr:NCS2 family permease [candidate division Zixibacteria bacterium]
MNTQNNNIAASAGNKAVNNKTEVLAGATTFLTMAYIIFVHPDILAAAGMDRSALIAVTCIAAGIASIATGLISKTPIAMAPGMGMNAYFAYSIVLGDKVAWPTALGIVFVAGVLFLLLTLIGIRQKLVDAIPRSLVFAISVGIGLFITFMGLSKIGVVVSDPATLVTAGELTPTVLIGLAGLLVMVVLEQKNIRGSLLIGIIFATLLAVIFGYSKLPSTWVTFDIDISATAFKLDILGALKGGLFGSIFALMFIDMFDSIGTVVACAHKAELVDEHGRIQKIDQLLGIDAAATILGSFLGTSPVTAYIESGAGIEQGGRTGRTAVTAGVLFLLSIIFIPVIGIVPGYATGPALVMVGLYMMREVTKIDFSRMDEAFPSFIIVVMIALSYSISTGLAFGFISFTLLKIATGKFRELHPAMWVIFVLSVIFFVV